MEQNNRTCGSCIHVKQCKYLQMLQDNKAAFEQFVGDVVKFPVDVLQLAEKCTDYKSPKQFADELNVEAEV